MVVSGRVAGISSYILDGNSRISVCLVTSGRLLLGVDIMTRFSCNESFCPLFTHTHMHTTTHTHKQLLEHLVVKPYLQQSQ